MLATTESYYPKSLATLKLWTSPDTDYRRKKMVFPVIFQSTNLPLWPGQITAHTALIIAILWMRADQTSFRTWNHYSQNQNAQHLSGRRINILRGHRLNRKDSRHLRDWNSRKHLQVQWQNTSNQGTTHICTQKKSFEYVLDTVIEHQ